MEKYRVNERVLFHHCDGLIPSIVRDVNNHGYMVRLEIVGNKHHRAWLGLHWVDTRNVSRDEGEESDEQGSQEPVEQSDKVDE